MVDSRKMIWIVDDDPGILEVTKIVVEDAGFLVKTFSSADALFQALSTRIPHLILLDILLAGVNGVEVCKKLKLNQKFAHIPVIMMSADPKVAEKHTEAGADDFINKPFDIAELEACVKKYTSV